MPTLTRDVAPAPPEQRQPSWKGKENHQPPNNEDEDSEFQLSADDENEDELELELSESEDEATVVVPTAK